MKALMFGWEGFPPHNTGGMGVACMGLTRALASEGVQLTYVLPKRIPIYAPWCSVVFADRRPAYEVCDEALKELNSAYISSKAYDEIRQKYPELAHIYGSLYDEVLRYAVLARRIAMEEEHDVIHAHDWLTFLAGIEARAISGKPLVAHVHATEFDRTGNGGINQMVYAIERAGMHAADKVIAVSNYTKQMLVKHYGVPEDKIEVVHNGIDYDDATIARSAEGIMHALKRKNQSIVLFVGRITLQKGPDYFLRAAKRVLDHRPNTVFVISGSGDMERQIIQEAAYMGIGEKVLFVGFLRGETLARMYKLADLVIMPSVSEPFGIVPLEAAANGTPVIISKQSGVSETLSHALKVDFWDTDEMANQVINVLNHSSLQETMRAGSLREVGGIVWKKAAEKVQRVYAKIVHTFAENLKKFS